MFPATTRNFTKDMALSEHGSGAAWHVRINGTAWQGNGMGMAWTRHGHGMLCVKRPHVSYSISTGVFLGLKFQGQEADRLPFIASKFPKHRAIYIYIYIYIYTLPSYD
jgi:hypothetical protein